MAEARTTGWRGASARGLAGTAAIAALAAGLLAGPGSARMDAHHSFAVEYDAEKPVEGAGVISKVEWTNPHMRIYVDVPGPGGTVTTWNLELGSPNSVLRRGWTKKDLKPGDKVTFKGYGGRTVVTRSVADSLTLADGRSFAGASGAPDAPGK